jgi:hypothetical protein
MAGTGLFQAAAYCHPSHSRVPAVWGEKLEDIVNAVQCPILNYTGNTFIHSFVHQSYHYTQLIALFNVSVNVTHI